MRTVETEVFSFEELSESAKEKAIEWYRNQDTEIAWASDNRESMEKFAEIFPIKVTDWSYGGRGEGVSFHFTCDDCIEELSGQRLATYIWNNYRDSIFKGKYYHSSWDVTDHRVIHKRIRSKQITNNCPNKGKWFNAYHSKITLSTSCVLTGYCMDDAILNPIYKFLDDPIHNWNFKDLLEECFSAWIKACNDDVEYQNSDDYIIESIRANDYEFEEDGTIF